MVNNRVLKYRIPREITGRDCSVLRMQRYSICIQYLEGTRERQGRRARVGYDFDEYEVRYALLIEFSTISPDV